MDFTKFSIATQPKIDSIWTTEDYFGALKVRLSIKRNNYRVKAGLYKLGNPGVDDEVIVTSNYKLTFDTVRRSLKGINVWILVLETYGINVWCAAGKGTFGTDELIRQINESQLLKYISHKRIIAPQLGAPGISAYKVKNATGVIVKFGPVRAKDIKDYLAAGYKKTQKMRTVEFNIFDRLILTPVEIVNSLRYLLYAILAVFLISGIQSNGYSLSALWQDGIIANIYLVIAYVSGAFIAPVILPWLPFKSFAGKGLIAGLLVFMISNIFNHENISVLFSIGWLLISGAVSSFLTMNFTGATTYTSLSGVRKEMRIFVPIQIGLTLIGLTAFIISKFV